MIEIPSQEATLQSMMDRLSATTPINAVSPGSIARSLLEAINSELQKCYRTLDINMMQCFVSTATGVYLDKIGELVGIVRRPNEGDTNYRYRIINSAYTYAKANETAIKLAALGVDGVKDVKLVEYSHGNGSFTVFVITDSIVPSPTIMSNVQAVVNTARAAGVKAYVTYPTTKQIDANIFVSFISTATNTDLVMRSVTTGIKQEVDGMGMGAVLPLNRLTDSVMTTGVARYASLMNVAIDGIKTIEVSSINAKWNERLAIRSINYLT